MTIWKIQLHHAWHQENLYINSQVSSHQAFPEFNKACDSFFCFFFWFLGVVGVAIGKFFSCWVVEIRREFFFTILKSSTERERERASQLPDRKQRKPNFSKNGELWCAITCREMELAREKCSCRYWDWVQRSSLKLSFSSSSWFLFPLSVVNSQISQGVWSEVPFPPTSSFCVQQPVSNQHLIWIKFHHKQNVSLSQRLLLR